VTVDAPQTLAATVVAVVSDGHHAEAAATLTALRRSTAVHAIVISLGTRGDAPREDQDGVVVFKGLLPRYLNNAVASLRLSSLPAMGWWRTPDVDTINDLAVLVDRLVLDQPDPIEEWRRIPALADVTAVSDLRWARLTRWRELLAQFYDLPDVRRMRVPFDTLELSGSDPADLSLFAGWLKARLPDGAGLRVVRIPGTHAPLERVQLTGPAGCVTLALRPDSGCVQTSLETGTRTSSTRIVPAGDPRLDVLLRGELRIRARDLAFEHAAREAAAL
jgi:glucose-6-phosphate dehydrogenase assembly protein OpcA